VTADTTLRRYAPDSIKFDDAKPAAPITAVKPGDQLRARGARSEDGNEIRADEIVSGSFRNIAGTVISADAATGLLTLQDLAAKKPVTLKVTAESQLRKLPAPIAQRIAVRLKGGTPDVAAPEGSAAPKAMGGPAPNDAQRGRPVGTGQGAGAGPGTSGGMGRAGGSDFQQVISHMPAATLGDLQKGDAVMLVATEGTATTPSTVITLLGGVEPILQASPNSTASTILSPWSLNSPGEGGATP